MHSVAEEEEYVRFSHVEWEEYRVFDFGIFFEGRFVGSCGSHHMSWEDECCEVGYWIAGAYEGRGLISEAVGLLEAELLRLGFFRIEIRCDPKNLRSAAVPKRCGYELEAILKSHKIEQGERRDTMIWSKLR
jgi:RimJ/RimL family protein N-acetyltransferase